MKEASAMRFTPGVFGVVMLVLLVAIMIAYPSFSSAVPDGCYNEYVTPRRPDGATPLTLGDDALSGLPENAAWQGVANDGANWFLLTSETPDGAANQIRKYDITTGDLVAANLDAYSNAHRFSSGEVIDGLLYVVVRGHYSSWSHVVAYDPSDLTVVKDVEIANVGYMFPEGVDKHDGYWWVVFGGCGTFKSPRAKASAVIRYDADWSNPVPYELFANVGAQIGGQDIRWSDEDEIVTAHHDRGAFQVWRWTGTGFDLVQEYALPDEEPGRPFGQGFTYRDGKLYFVGRYSNRLTETRFPQ